jgi:hypothetical protein
MPEGFAGEGCAGAGAAGRLRIGASRSSLFSESLVAGILGTIDATIVMTVGLGALLVYWGLGDPFASIHVVALILIAALIVLLFHFAGLYRFETVAAWPRKMRRVLYSLVTVLFVLTGLCFAV